VPQVRAQAGGAGLPKMNRHLQSSMLPLAMINCGYGVRPFTAELVEQVEADLDAERVEWRRRALSELHHELMWLGSTRPEATAGWEMVGDWQTEMYACRHDGWRRECVRIH